MEWQPIETAPRDFTPIVVFVPGTWETPNEIHVAFWKRNAFRLQEDDHVILYPTHWMPLPEPSSSAFGQSQDLPYSKSSKS
jgi:hypothetical protein